MFKKIVISSDLPLREVLAAWGVINLGGDIFPCSPDPEIVMINPGEKIRKAKSIFFANNGTSGEVLNEIAKNDEAFQRLLLYLERDTPPAGVEFGIRSLRQASLVDLKRVLDWAFDSILIRYLSHKRYLKLEEIKRSTIIAEKNISYLDQQKHNVVVIEKDSNFSKSYLKQYGASVLIHFLPSGYARIVTNLVGDNFRNDLIGIIRIAENQMKGPMERKKIDYRSIVSEGILLEVPEWKFDRVDGSITNIAKPTKLTAQDLMRFVTIAMNEQIFDVQFAKECMAGYCRSIRDNPCSFFRLGLSRCQARRKNMQNKGDEL